MFEPDFCYPEAGIWDNLFDDIFIYKIDAESNRYHWKLANVANAKSYPHKLKGSHIFWGISFLPNEEYPEILKDILNHLLNNIVPKNYKLKSIHLNAQSLGQNGTCHTDAEPNSGELTLMVFINNRWQKEWGGDFQLLANYSNNADVVHSIPYVPGRVILFDATIPHRALAPNEPYVVRKSLVFRLEKNNETNL